MPLKAGSLPDQLNDLFPNHLPARCVYTCVRCRKGNSPAAPDHFPAATRTFLR
jgi:hypothetical protein